MSVLGRLLAHRNPNNETRIHLRAVIARYGAEIGTHSYGRIKVRFPDHGARLTIGRFCSFADNVEVFLGGNHRIDHVSTFPFGAFARVWPNAGSSLADYATTKGDVRIGSDVWIGSGAILLSGVTIGHGAAIGARSVVTRDVAPYSVVGGNPAKEIRTRFTPDIVEALLDTKWWDWPDAEISRFVPLLQASDIAAFLQAAARRG